MNKKGIGLALTAGLLLSSCPVKKDTVPTQTPEKPKVMQARQAVVAKVKTVFKFFTYCGNSWKEVKDIAENRCSKQKKIKFYREKRGPHCVNCEEEKEVFE